MEPIVTTEMLMPLVKMALICLLVAIATGIVVVIIKKLFRKIVKELK